MPFRPDYKEIICNCIPMISIKIENIIRKHMHTHIYIYHNTFIIEYFRKEITKIIYSVTCLQKYINIFNGNYTLRSEVGIKFVCEQTSPSSTSIEFKNVSLICRCWKY
jgi:hypothetical protein